MNKEELLKAVDELQNEYDAYMGMNRYLWEERDNSHAKQFKLLEDANLKGDLVNDTLCWIHDCYDCHECRNCFYCYYENEKVEDGSDPFEYLRGVIEDEFK